MDCELSPRWAQCKAPGGQWKAPRCDNCKAPEGEWNCLRKQVGPKLVENAPLQVLGAGPDLGLCRGMRSLRFARWPRFGPLEWPLHADYFWSLEWPALHHQVFLWIHAVACPSIIQDLALHPCKKPEKVDR